MLLHILDMRWFDQDGLHSVIQKLENQSLFFVHKKMQKFNKKEELVEEFEVTVKPEFQELVSGLIAQAQNGKSFTFKNRTLIGTVADIFVTDKLLEQNVYTGE